MSEHFQLSVSILTKHYLRKRHIYYEVKYELLQRKRSFVYRKWWGKGTRACGHTEDRLSLGKMIQIFRKSISSVSREEITLTCMAPIHDAVRLFFGSLWIKSFLLSSMLFAVNISITFTPVLTTMLAHFPISGLCFSPATSVQAIPLCLFQISFPPQTIRPVMRSDSRYKWISRRLPCKVFRIKIAINFL